MFGADAAAGVRASVRCPAWAGSPSAAGQAHRLRGGPSYRTRICRYGQGAPAHPSTSSSSTQFQGDAPRDHHHCQQPHLPHSDDACRGDHRRRNNMSIVPRIRATFQEAGVPTLMVTTKDRLRRLLGNGGVSSVSVEKAPGAGLPEYGVEDLEALVGEPAPGIYDPRASRRRTWRVGRRGLHHRYHRRPRHEQQALRGRGAESALPRRHPARCSCAHRCHRPSHHRSLHEAPRCARVIRLALPSRGTPAGGPRHPASARSVTGPLADRYHANTLRNRDLHDLLLNNVTE